MPGAPPDLNLGGAAHDVVGDEGPSAGVAGAELPLPVGDVLHLAVGLHLGDYDVVELLAEVAEEDEGVPDLLHRSLVLRTDGEAEDVEVCDVAYLVLGEGDSAAEVPRDGEGAVGGTEFPAVEGRPDQGRLELVAVELDGAVAVVPHVRPLDEVEDAGSMRNR